MSSVHACTTHVELYVYFNNMCAFIVVSSFRALQFRVVWLLVVNMNTSSPYYFPKEPQNHHNIGEDKLRYRNELDM